MEIINELIKYAKLLNQEGFLLNSQDLFYYHNKTIYYIKEKTDLSKIEQKDIKKIDVETTLSKDHNQFSIYSSLYRKKQTLAVLISENIYTKAASKAGKIVYPLLDDMAQMIGPSVRLADDRHLYQKLKNRSAVLIKKRGGLCVADNFYDLHAVAMVLEKACRAHIESYFLGGGKKIHFIEALLMRFIYLTKYSKKAKKKTITA